MTRTDQHQAFEKHVFLGEIECQSQLAARAAERLVIRDGHFDSMEIWSAIQSILVAAGNVSKILWPSRRSSAQRGAMLREPLEIAEDNVLANRSFRNHFEHYDERLEDWLSRKTSAGYVDQLVGEKTGFMRGFPQSVHRAYDPSTQTLTYRDESMHLKPLLIALDEIRVRCRLITYL
jgi:hypothetical protein